MNGAKIELNVLELDVLCQLRECKLYPNKRNKRYLQESVDACIKPDFSTDTLCAAIEDFVEKNRYEVTKEE